MSEKNPAHGHERQALFFGLLGIAGFSLTLPATRLAVQELDPTFVGLGRAVIAGVLAAALLLFTRSGRPRGSQWWYLAATAFGVVLGFPMLSALAMRYVPASHGAVITGLLPLATALFAACLAGERPRLPFWLSLLVGSGAIAVFALQSGGGHFQAADGLMVGAALVCGFGYAAGGRLARELGSWQTVCWALVISAPLLAVPVARVTPADWHAIGWSALLGFAYVSLISMFLAFFAWYRALALGGIARIGQIQLLQPFLTLLASALWLGEPVGASQLLAAATVIACVFVGRRYVNGAPRVIARDGIRAVSERP
jgi:drug/metabolite transporter (DMT)-like permease